jgi:glycosyltransferase involved in cell wall biosynthesis
LAGPPQLTIAIPTCNGARHLAAALRGVLAQEGVAFELLICDDRSDDDTLAVVRAEAGDRARVVVNGERLGLAGNWNRCVALAEAPLVAVFHQDDVMRPGHLAAHAAAFAAEPRLGLAWSAAELVDDVGRVVAGTAIERGGLDAADRTYPPGALLRELAVGNPVRCSAVTVRGATHAEAGGFDPSYRYALDWDFWIRVARRRPVAWLARPGTTDLDEQGRLLADLYSRDGAAWPDARRLRRTADRRLARAFLNRAHEALRGGDPPLARRCLARAVALAPRILGTIARDPRLAVPMLALALAPGVAGRLFSRPLRS